MYNIKKAVSRLDFAPRLEEIKVTDIKQGLGEFTPKPTKPASFAALKAALKKAGYTLASAEITVAGLVARDASGWWIDNDTAKQRLALTGDDVDRVLSGFDAGARIEITGDWQTIGAGSNAREVIHLRIAKTVPAAKSSAAEEAAGSKTQLDSIQVSLNGVGTSFSLIPAPVRTTSPGLTVYRGGAFTPRYFFVRQHLDGLEVTRQAVRLAVSYTPTPTLQLEAEVPIQTTSSDDGVRSDSGSGFGNITVWASTDSIASLRRGAIDRVRFGLDSSCQPVRAATLEIAF